MKNAIIKRLNIVNGIIEKYKEQENKVIDMLIDNEIEKRELGKILRSDIRSDK